MLAWLAWCFVALGLLVDIRVVPNLETIAKTLGLSDTLAGVTLLALGNGAVANFV
jgi:sodium/potassium/calcium exchanger 6